MTTDVTAPGFLPAAGAAGTLFHPCIVLLLDDEGRRIGEHLAELLACLPAAMRTWVELVPVGEHDLMDVGALEQRIAAALARVTNVHARDAVRQAGYHVGDAVPLVLLAGHTTTRTLLTGARACYHATARAFTGAPRIALLSDTRPSDPAAARTLDELARDQPWDALLGWVGSSAHDPEPPLGLCLLYQDVDERNWHWNAPPAQFDGSAPGTNAATTEPEDVRYAVAEAAFALIASGIADTPALREQLRLNMPTVPGTGGEAERRFGTLATARLAFPRAQAEAATAAYAGAELLEAWMRDAEAHERTLSGELASADSSARRLIQTIRDATDDSLDPKLRRGGMGSPPLSAQGVSRLFGIPSTQSDPARIFAAFRATEVAREQHATGSTLAEALGVLHARARDRFARWSGAATHVWTDFGARAAESVAAQVDDDLVGGPAGLAKARAYLRALGQSVAELRERQEDAERYRAAGMQRFMHRLAAEVDDLTPASPRVQAPESESGPAVVPTAHAAAIVAVAGNVTGADDGDATELPTGMRLLANALASQFDRDAGLLSSAWTMLAALVMLLPFLAYASVGLTPLLPYRLPALRVGASQLVLAPVLTVLLLSLLVAAPPLLLFRARLARVRRIRRLLVGIHVRWWADRCGAVEDALRRRGIQTLSDEVEDRLAAIAQFEQRLRTAAATLRARATAAEQALAQGPASRRDMFVLAGRRFPAVGLADLHQRIVARRQSDPLHPSHATADALAAAFRGRLRLDEVSLLSRSADDLAAQAQDFGASVCHPYLAGELVTVTPSLHVGAPQESDDRVALGALLERATPLFRPLATDSTHRHRVLAAPVAFQMVEVAAGASGVTHIPTPSVEWLLVGQLVSHGRPRWWRRTISVRAEEGGRVHEYPPRVLAHAALSGAQSASR